MADRREYTADEKHAALELYELVGPGETHRRTGIPKGTLESWAYRGGVQAPAPERTRAATEAYKAKNADRRQRVIAKLWQIADEATDAELAALHDSPLRDIVGARTRAIHDANLLGGDATERADFGLQQDVAAEADGAALRLVG